MLLLFFTDELVCARNVGLLVARSAALCLVCLVPWGCRLGTGRALGGTGGFGWCRSNTLGTLVCPRSCHGGCLWDRVFAARL